MIDSESASSADRGSVAAATITGSANLFIRQLILLAVGFGATVLLSRLLTPSDYGVYSVSAVVVSIFDRLSGIGLGAALVQRREEPTPDMLAGVFTTQFAIGVVAASVIWLASGSLVAVTRLPAGSEWVIRSLSFGLIVTSFVSISVRLLERRLRYDRLAAIDVVSQGSYHLVTVVGAILGFGYWSFACGVLAAACWRLALSFRSAPWRVALKLPDRHILELLRFGVVWQGTTWASLGREHFVTLLVAPLLGHVAMGYLAWAQSLTSQTSQVFARLIARVSFASLSRLPTDEEKREFFATSLRWLLMATTCLLVVLTLTAPHLVRFVFSDVWTPAVPLLYLFAVRSVGSNAMSLGVSTLGVQGRVAQALRIVLLWTTLDVPISLVAAHFWGYVGVAFGHAVAGVIPAILMLRLVGKGNRRMWADLLVILLASLCAAGAGWLSAHAFPDWIGLLVVPVVILTTYAAVIATLIGDRVRREIAYATRIFTRRRAAAT